MCGRDGAGSYYPGWPDPGCHSARLPVDVRVFGQGGAITGSWNADSRLCQRSRPERWCGYSYEWERTPQILSITPRTASPCSLITITGRTCVGDLYDETGELRTQPALKRFERVLIGEHLCELSDPACDVETTRQCPTMHAANTTRGPYKPGGYTCQEGMFQCRVPCTMPLGWHNVSFRLPSTFGTSMLLADAVAPGLGPGL